MFALWLDDENLQKQEIYLPSLPKQYDTHRLAKIMQRQQVRVCLTPAECILSYLFMFKRSEPSKDLVDCFE